MIFRSSVARSTVPAHSTGTSGWWWGEAGESIAPSVGPGGATDPPSEPERWRIQGKMEGVIAVDKDMRYSNECVTSRALTCSACIAAPRESRHARGGERRRQRLRTTAPTKTPLIRLERACSLDFFEKKNLVGKSSNLSRVVVREDRNPMFLS